MLKHLLFIGFTPNCYPLKRLLVASVADANIVRAKGVFRIGRDWRLVNLVGGQVDIQPIAYRRDSRVELIVHAQPAPDWAAIDAGLGLVAGDPVLAK